jgi:hypothetical protein
MAWNSRKASKDAVALNVGGSDILALFRDTGSRKAAADIDLGAVKDTYKITGAGRITWDIPITVAVEDQPFVLALVGTNVTFSHDLAGTATTGTAMLLDADHQSGGMDGAQTCAFTLKVQTVN